MSKKRQEILAKTEGKCFYCGCELPAKGWHADHFHPIIRKLEERYDDKGRVIGYTTGKACMYPELDTIDNLVPSCAPCNNFKHSSTIEGYRWLVAEQFENTLKNSTGLRQLNRLGLIDISEKPVTFWFERQGIHAPDIWAMLGVSDEARECEWKVDNSEPDYYHRWFGDSMVTLRRISNYWLVISITKDWDSSLRTEIPNGRTDIVKALASEWALRNVTGAAA